MVRMFRGMSRPPRHLGTQATAALCLVSLAVGAGVQPASADDRIVERVSVRADGAESEGGSSFDAALSAEGRLIAFTSDASNLVDGDTNAASDVFVRDVVTAAVERISVGPGGRQADGDSSGPSISSDGRLVVFSSIATNLVDGDGNAAWDVFVHDRRDRGDDPTLDRSGWGRRR